jgi:hypothetical protein
MLGAAAAAPMAVGEIASSQYRTAGQIGQIPQASYETMMAQQLAEVEKMKFHKLKATQDALADFDNVPDEDLAMMSPGFGNCPPHIAALKSISPAARHNMIAAYNIKRSREQQKARLIERIAEMTGTSKLSKWRDLQRWL